MELTRKDIKMTQGLAILTMVSLHLFCRLGTDVYGTPLLWLNSTTPAVYILGCQKFVFRFTLFVVDMHIIN